MDPTIKKHTHNVSIVIQAARQTHNKKSLSDKVSLRNPPKTQQRVSLAGLSREGGTSKKGLFLRTTHLASEDGAL